MGTILDKILDVKRKEVVEMKNSVQHVGNPPHTQNSLLKRIEKGSDMTIIAEFKRASPSKGDINLGVSPEIQAQKYMAAGADAVSVLTDQTFFKGSYKDLAAVRKHIKAPILCKEFIIDQIQIDAARSAGADVILLIAAALDDEKLHELYHYACEKDLEVLMEVHNEEEAERVLQTANPLIGVNNRDLKTFKVDLGTTEKVAALIKKEGRYLISESGLKTSKDVERVAAFGANGILVGEAFMAHHDPAEAIRQMKLSIREEVVE